MSRVLPGVLKRRGFLGSVLVAGGATMGWAVRHFHSREAFPAPASTPLPPDGFAYDVSAFEKTDPALLLYTPAAEFSPPFADPKRVADWSPHGLVVAGAQSLAVVEAEGEPVRRWTLPSRTHALSPAGPDELLVAYQDRFEIFDAAGKSKYRSPPLGPRTYLTSLAAGAESIFLADAGNREIVACERASGRLQQRFGHKDATSGNPGFNVPSPYFALALASDDLLRVVNPGLLRIETYTLDGRYVSAWGQPGMAVDRFCGCCNPVYFALTATGDFVTSEKGLARIHLYSAEGVFKGVVAGPDLLVTDKELAKRACQDCRIGAGFDVALSADDRVFALDPFRKVIRSFRPTSRV